MQKERRRQRRRVADGRNDPLSMAISRRDRDTLQMVEEALRTDQTLLVYQPIVQATRRKRPAFHEGLIRVLDASGRIIPAKDFIDVVENTEIGRMIDCAALSKGLDALELNPGLRLAINMSARSIGYRRWQTILDQGLARSDTIGERLILEITEASAMSMPEIVISFMDDLQARGISFALDDFGTGFTSFRYLNQFYFDILKIDGEFIRGIDTNPDNQVLARALIGIGRHFDMFTVAERVEREEEAAFLTEAGIDCLQGYLFGAPSASPPAIRTVREDRRRSA